MRAATVETQENKIRNIGQENSNVVPLRIIKTVAFMDQYISTAEERPTKKRPVHNIGCMRTTMETVS